MNNITLVGRLTADPDIRTAKNKEKTKIANFSLAVFRDKDTTDFFNCVAFGATAGLIESYFKKGLRVAVSGSVNIDIVADKKDPEKNHYYTKVIVRGVEICQSKKESGESNSSTSSTNDEWVNSNAGGKPPWEQ